MQTNNTQTLPINVYCLGNESQISYRGPSNSYQAERYGYKGAWAMGWLCQTEKEGTLPPAPRT